MSLPDGQSGAAGASFRDPNGFLFTLGGVLYRQINEAYRPHYTLLQETGLYDELVADGLLIPHQEVDVPPPAPAPLYSAALPYSAAPLYSTAMAWKVIQPQPVQFISYPYEWSFSQLKDAALLTLKIQERALQHGLWLKDASAYNIQFHQGRPLLIDTLSFETYPEGQPWVAYRQFCQHFLAPLALMALVDVRLGQLLRLYIDGIPLDLASRLLPIRTRFSIPLLLHLHLHAASQKRFAGQAVSSTANLSKIALLGLQDNLKSAIRGLRWSPRGTAESGTAWSSYYAGEHNYTPAGLEHKRNLVSEFLQTAHPASLWDLGANTGYFSRLASSTGIATLACDVDPGAVELNYMECKRQPDEHLLPLLIDLTNPTPASGWHNRERMSLMQRGPAQAVMALALIHHLAITNNVPLDRLAAFFRECGEWLIIEFIPKSDSQVQRLLVSRADIFPNYTRQGFEAAFGQVFSILRSEPIRDSERTLYLMRAI